ncbi:MAG: alkaline phosphatase, partial [Pirellulaceae bacterium]
ASLDQESKPVSTSLSHDNTGWALIEGLKADTKYYYRVVILDAKATNGRVEKTGRSGSFRTLPDAADHLHPQLNPRGLFNFKFEYACGNNQNPFHSVGPALPTFKTMLAELKDNIHFAILNGDWLYESQRL